MNTNSLRRLWSQGKAAVQAWDMTGHPEICSLMAEAGYDAVVLDWQHGPGVTETTVVPCIDAINAVPGVASLVRLPSVNDYYISHVLDAGASGVIVPMIRSADEARIAGAACRYAPEGHRSMGYAPHMRSGETLQEYTLRANREIICLVMIETKEALECVEEVCGVPGIDGLYIGPFDLSLNMGVEIATWPEDPRHLAAADRIFSAAKQKNLVVGHHGMNPAVSAKFVKLGSQLCQLGGNTSLFEKAAKDALLEFRQELEN